MAELKFVVGDTRRSVVANLWEEDDAGVRTPVDLSGCTVLFRMVNTRANELGLYEVKIDNKPASIITDGTGGANAKVQYDWEAADVNTKGIYHAWFIVSQAGPREHFPNDYELFIYINPDDGTAVDESLA